VNNPIQLAEKIVRSNLNERGEDLAPARQNANVLGVAMRGMSWSMGARMGGAYRKINDTALLDMMTYVREGFESLAAGRPDMAKAYFRDVATQAAKLAASIPDKV
jgi:hypothetical protein